MKKISIKDIFNKSWEDFKTHWRTLVSVGALMVLISLVSSFELDTPEYMSAPELALGLLAGLLSLLVTLGFVRMLIRLVDGEKVEFSDLFKGISAKLFFSFFLVGILYGLIIGIGFVLFVIPGMILMVALYPAQYLVADERAGVIQAIKKSWYMTKGNRWKILWFMLLTIIISMVTIIPIIGFLLMLVVIPLLTIASVRIYKVLLNNDKEVKTTEEVTVEEKEDE